PREPRSATRGAAVMAEERGLLMLADIGGDNRFMRLHRLSVAHAQDVTARLLSAVGQACPGLSLVEIEGGAGGFFRPDAPAEPAPGRSRRATPRWRCIELSTRRRPGWWPSTCAAARAASRRAS